MTRPGPPGPGGGPPAVLLAHAEVDVVPVTPHRLPRLGREPATVGDERAVRRLIHRSGRPIVITAARAGGALRLSADATGPDDAAFGVERARFWSGVDDDLRPFLARFAGDPLIGRSIAEAPGLRPPRRPMPFEALVAAVCEQLVDDARARATMRAIVAGHGPGFGELRDVPDASAVAALAPAQLERCGLTGTRAIALRAAAREVAAGRVDLLDPGRREAGWRRLRAIRGIGPWTLQSLALFGQGLPDALPAGDLAYRLLVARHAGRPPGSKADPSEVEAFFVPYAGWRGIAGWHLLREASVAARRPTRR